MGKNGVPVRRRIRDCGFVRIMEQKSVNNIGWNAGGDKIPVTEVWDLMALVTIISSNENTSGLLKWVDQ